MYTMVLMMAATTGGDTASFGLLRGSCQGSCHGANVVATAPASSCTGSMVVASSCHGGSSCQGSGMFGLRGKLGGLFQKSCHGSTVSSCHGNTISSCHGSNVAVSSGCTGNIMTATMTSDCPPASVVVGAQGTVPTPATMPKAEPKKDEQKKKMD